VYYQIPTDWFGYQKCIFIESQRLVDEMILIRPCKKYKNLLRNRKRPWKILLPSVSSALLENKYSTKWIQIEQIHNTNQNTKTKYYVQFYRK
jgi:hypothetical protein